MSSGGNGRFYGVVLGTLWFAVLHGFLSQGWAESRLALVIGNGAYRQEAILQAPPNDAQLMARTLRFLRFELFGGRAHVNLTEEHMRRLIKDFARELTRRREAVGLFYYSGHGLQVDNRNFMIPVDVEIKDRVDVRVHGISIDEEVLGRMSQATPVINILLLDACRNNPFEKRIKAVGMAKGLGDMRAERGSIIGFASEPNTVAYESKGTYSYFTEALAQELLQPGVSLTQVLRRVRVAVRNATNGEQVPTTREVLFDEFYLAPGPELRPSPPVPASTKKREVYWEIGRKNHSNADFDISPRYEHKNDLWPKIVTFNIHTDKAKRFPGYLCSSHPNKGPALIEIIYKGKLDKYIRLVISFIGEGPWQWGRSEFSATIDEILLSKFNIKAKRGEKTKDNQVGEYIWSEVKLDLGNSLGDGSHTISLAQQKGCIKLDHLKLEPVALK